MSKDRLDKLWEKYTNDLKSRRNWTVKNHIATRWRYMMLSAALKDNTTVIHGRVSIFSALGENESNFD